MGAKKDEHEKIWKALAKYGIYTEAELNEAIKKMKPPPLAQPLLAIPCSLC